MAGVLCPSCGELNREGATVCIRCEKVLPGFAPFHSPYVDHPPVGIQVPEMTWRPPWLTNGVILAIVGGVLLFAGYMTDLVRITLLTNLVSLDLQQLLAELSDGMLGFGFLFVVLGWVSQEASRTGTPP